jgi:hypothetical protein
LGILGACPAEQNIAAVYPLNATVPIDPLQLQAIIDEAQAQALPTDECCTAVGPFVEGACYCDEAFFAILPPGVVTPEGLDGILQVISAGCGLEILPCA